jgi:hypothetical protein
MLVKKWTVAVRFLLLWEVMRVDLPQTGSNDMKADLEGTDAGVCLGPCAFDASLLPELKPF